MKSLQTTLMLLAAAILLTQTVRHIHLLFYGDEPSVTEQFAPNFADKKRMRSEESDENLLQEYETVMKEINALEKNQDDERKMELREEHAELYGRSRNLNVELHARELRRREIRDLWIFSGAGVVMIAIGGIFYLRNARWIGMSFVIAGFLELLWWSSPVFGMGGGAKEYRLLLWNKVGVSALAIVLLYISWWLAERSHRRDSGVVTETNDDSP